MKRLIVALALAGGLILGFGGSADAVRGGVPAEQDYICHYDAGEDAYVLLYAATNSAHFDADKHPDDLAAVVAEDGTVSCDFPEEPTV